MLVSIEVFDWERKEVEKLIKKFKWLEGKFTPKGRRLKFPTIRHYECFLAISRLNLEKKDVK